jgi:hypothetical protein
MNRAAKVVSTARDVLAALEGNHPDGVFIHPEEVGADMLRAALIEHDAEPTVTDGGCSWDMTIAGLIIYGSDGRIAARIACEHVPDTKPERDSFARQFAEVLGLITVSPTAPTSAER